MSAKAVFAAIAISFVGLAVCTGAGTDAYDNAPEAHRDWYISTYEKSVKGLENAIAQRQASIRRMKTRPERQRAASVVAAMKDRLATLQKNDPPFLPDLGFEGFEVGRIGRLDGGVPAYSQAQPYSIEVVQVLGDDEMLVLRSGRTTQVVGSQQGSVTTRTVPYKSKPFKIVGVSTQGAATGRAFQLDGAFRVEGTETYETIDGGSNSVFVLRQIGNPNKPFASDE